MKTISPIGLEGRPRASRHPDLGDHDLLLLRGNLLNPEDKALLEMVFERGGTFEQIARLTGHSASTVSRRFHRVLEKLLARELTALLRQGWSFASLEVSVVRAYYLQGLSQTQVARQLGLSSYRVRQVLHAVRGLIYHNAICHETDHGDA